MRIERCKQEQEDRGGDPLAHRGDAAECDCEAYEWDVAIGAEQPAGQEHQRKKEQNHHRQAEPGAAIAGDYDGYRKQ